MSYAWSDGGRALAGIREHNDCTVRAFAVVAGIPYEFAHAACGVRGRKSRRGFRKFEHAVPLIAEDLGIVLQALCFKGTIEGLRLAHPQGDLMVCIRGHAFAIKDGVVHDQFIPSPRTKVQFAWIKVQPSTPHPK